MFEEQFPGQGSGGFQARKGEARESLVPFRETVIVVTSPTFSTRTPGCDPAYYRIPPFGGAATHQT